MIRRREFVALLGSAAAWPLAARAQQPAMPVVGFIDGGSPDTSASYAAAFRKGLGETGYVEGQNVTVEYHWLEGQYDRLPALMEDLVRRRVALIATPGASAASIAAFNGLRFSALFFPPLKSGDASMSSRSIALHRLAHMPSPEAATLMWPSLVLYAEVGMLVGWSLPTCGGTSPFMR